MAGKAKPTIMIVVAVLAVTFAVVQIKRIRRKPVMPDEVASEPIVRIDEKTLELIALPLKEWLKLGSREGKYKNPRTGEYTICEIHICNNCHMPIPSPVIPPEGGPEATEKAFSGLVCPRCGKKVSVWGSTPSDEALRLYNEALERMRGKKATSP